MYSPLPIPSCCDLSSSVPGSPRPSVRCLKTQLGRVYFSSVAAELSIHGMLEGKDKFVNLDGNFYCGGYSGCCPVLAGSARSTLIPDGPFTSTLRGYHSLGGYLIERNGETDFHKECN
jgi:hypothetical protein